MIFRSFITRDDLIPSINGITGPIRQTLEKFGSTIEKVELFADRKITSHKINQQGLIFLKKEIENKRIQYMCVQLDVGDFTKTPKNKILEELKTRYRNVWGKSEDDELTPLINSREINSKEWLISLHKDLRIEFKLTDDLNVIVNDDSTWGSILAGDLDRCIESGHKLNQFTANGNIDIPLVLVGEPGVEKKFLVRKIEQILFPYSQGIQEFDCNASNSNESLQQIFGNALDNTPGIIEEVENEMLYITGLEDANHEIQESIIDVISTRTFSPANSDRANTKEAKCLFVIGINGSLENVPNALLNNHYIIEIPSINDRKTDFEIIFKMISQEEGAANKIDFTPTCIDYLKRESWPDNIKGLTDFIVQCRKENFSRPNHIEWDDVKHIYKQTITKKWDIAKIPKIYPIPEGMSLADHIDNIQDNYVQLAWKRSENRFQNGKLNNSALMRYFNIPTYDRGKTIIDGYIQRNPKTD